MPAVGQQLEIAIELDRIHLFDPETERRLDALPRKDESINQISRH
jgi:hypothetical protein